MGDLGLGTTDDLVFVVVAVGMVLLLVFGALERRRHRRHLDQLRVRISVNGSRGKSTITRLLTGALAAGGYRPLGKTTGTEPKLHFGWDLDTEEDIFRRPEGPNINEQMEIVKRAHDEGADSLVVECMAVNPEYQLTFHEDMVDVTHLVICNALEDHLDEMGPTVADVAEVFAASIPRGQKVIAVPEPWLDTYREVAEARDSELVVARPDEVTEAQLRGYGHLVLPDHVAICLAVTRDLGIPDEVALEGMRNAPVDPYAMRVTEIGDAHDPAFFVNGFAANDPTSTLAVWEHIEQRQLPSDHLTVIMNCRADRMNRTQLFADDVLPQLPIDRLIVTGRQTKPVLRAAEEGRISGELVDLSGQEATAVTAALDGHLKGQIVFGVGNLHGGGVQLIEALEALRTDRAGAPAAPRELTRAERRAWAREQRWPERRHLTTRTLRRVRRGELDATALSRAAKGDLTTVELERAQRGELTTDQLQRAQRGERTTGELERVPGTTADAASSGGSSPPPDTPPPATPPPSTPPPPPPPGASHDAAPPADGQGDDPDQRGVA